MQIKSLLNFKGKETVALIGLNLLVIMGLVIFYVLVLKNKMPEDSYDVLGTSDCSTSYIQGYVYNDKNANGVRNSGEAPTPNVDVLITLQNGRRYTGVKTGTDGRYKICVEANQGARVEFLNLPGGYYPGPRGVDSKTTVSFTNTGPIRNISLGLLTNNDPRVIEIGNRVWEDDGDGIQEPGEPGIQGVVVRLVDYFNKDDEKARATTDSNGEFAFSSLTNSKIKDNAYYLILIDKSQFGNGKALDGYRTTTRDGGSNDSLDSDSASGKDFVEIPVIVGQAAACNLCIHNFDIGVRKVRTSGNTPTPTPYQEPGFPACASGEERLGQFEGRLYRDRDGQKVKTHNFTLNQDADIYVKGYVKEGHPEVGCPGSGNALCSQPQRNEEFKVEVVRGSNTREIGRYNDRGAVDAWFNVGPWNANNVQSGTNQLKFSHLLGGNTPESVDYKVTVCAKLIQTTPTSTATSTPTSTSTPTATPTSTPTTSRAPSGSPTTTPTDTPIATSTVTSTPEPTSTPTDVATPTTTPSTSVTVSSGPQGSPTGTPIGTGTSGDPQVSGASTTNGSPTGNPSVLPSTGLNTGMLIGLSGVSLLIGAFLIYQSKRRFKIRLGRLKK